VEAGHSEQEEPALVELLSERTGREADAANLGHEDPFHITPYHRDGHRHEAKKGKPAKKQLGTAKGKPVKKQKASSSSWVNKMVDKEATKDTGLVVHKEKAIKHKKKLHQVADNELNAILNRSPLKTVALQDYVVELLSENVSPKEDLFHITPTHLPGDKKKAHAKKKAQAHHQLGTSKHVKKPSWMDKMADKQAKKATTLVVLKEKAVKKKEKLKRAMNSELDNLPTDTLGEDHGSPVMLQDVGEDSAKVPKPVKKGRDKAAPSPPKTPKTNKYPVMDKMDAAVQKKMNDKIKAAQAAMDKIKNKEKEVSQKKLNAKLAKLEKEKNAKLAVKNKEISAKGKESAKACNSAYKKTVASCDQCGKAFTVAQAKCKRLAKPAAKKAAAKKPAAKKPADKKKADKKKAEEAAKKAPLALDAGTQLAIKKLEAKPKKDDK